MEFVDRLTYTFNKYNINLEKCRMILEWAVFLDPAQDIDIYMLLEKIRRLDIEKYLIYSLMIGKNQKNCWI